MPPAAANRRCAGTASYFLLAEAAPWWRECSQPDKEVHWAQRQALACMLADPMAGRRKLYGANQSVLARGSCQVIPPAPLHTVGHPYRRIANAMGAMHLAAPPPPQQQTAGRGAFNSTPNRCCIMKPVQAAVCLAARFPAGYRAMCACTGIGRAAARTHAGSSQHREQWRYQCCPMSHSARLVSTVMPAAPARPRVPAGASGMAGRCADSEDKPPPGHVPCIQVQLAHSMSQHVR